MSGSGSSAQLSIVSQKLLDSLSRFPVYGLLLIADPAHPMAKLVRSRWDQLNNMTGERFLLLAFQAPESYSRDFEDGWRKELGGEFAQVWDKWNAEKASSNDAYLDPRARAAADRAARHGG